MTSLPSPDNRLDDPPVRRGVVAVVHEAGRLLVIRRSQTVAAPGKFCFPGGGIEADEAEHQALVREMREELNVSVQPVRRLWQCTTKWGVELAWWHALLEPTSQLQPNAAEVASVHWLTPEELGAQTELLESNRDFLAALAVGEIELAL